MNNDHDYIVRELEQIKSSLHKWRSNNKNKEIIDNSDLIIKKLYLIIEYANSIDWNNYKDFIISITEAINLIFLGLVSMSNFSIVILSNFEMRFIYDFLNNEKSFKSFIDFQTKIVENETIKNKNNTGHADFIMHIILEISKSLNNKNSVNQLESIFLKEIKNIEEFFSNRNDVKIQYGYFKLLLIYTFSACISIKQIELILSKHHQKLKGIEAYLNQDILSSDENNFSAISRLIEFLILKYIHEEAETSPSMISHYTSMENFDEILFSGKIKFTSLKNTNDKDENNLLESKSNNDILSFSFSQKKDSLDLFGNYTKMSGISIVLDLRMLEDRLSGIAFKDGNMVTLWPFDVGFVVYDNNPQPKFNEYKDKVRKILGRFIPETHVQKGLKQAEAYLNYFFKKEPWKYEEEYRLVINVPKEYFKKEILSGYYDEQKQEFFLDLNLKEKGVIKEIIVGPEIKNSEFQMKILRNILESYGLSKVPIVKTESNYIGIK